MAGYVPSPCITEDDCPGVKCIAGNASKCKGGTTCTPIGALHESDLPLSTAVATGYAHTFALNWISQGIILSEEESDLETLIINELTGK